MAMLAQRRGVKGEPPTVNLSLSYEEIKVSYSRPQTRSKLLKIGFSASGIEELKNARPLSSLKDRQLAAAFIGDALK